MNKNWPDGSTASSYILSYSGSNDGKIERGVKMNL